MRELDRLGAARFALWVVALTLLGIGGVGLVAPETVVGMAGITAPGPVALSEARMLFGVFHLLVGGFFASAALGLSRTPIDSALVLAGVLFGGMGLARAAIVWVDGSWSNFHASGLVFDFVLAALAFWARRRVLAASGELDLGG